MVNILLLWQQDIAHEESPMHQTKSIATKMQEAANGR